MHEIEPTIKIKNSASVPESDCIFCKIVKKKVPSALVEENEKYIAFLDRAPFSIGHTLVCPKKHGETVYDMTEQEIGELFSFTVRITKAVVRATESDGFRLVQNNGEAANQMVPHVHVHVIPVKMSQKGVYMERKNPGMKELQGVATRIAALLN